MPSLRCGEDTARRIQLVVLGKDGVYQYYTVPQGQSWKVDPVNRELVIGRGVPRTHVPLDNVRSYTIEEY